MRIQLIKPYSLFAAGTILEDCQPNVAEQLIRRRVAKCIDAPPSDKMLKAFRVRRK